MKSWLQDNDIEMYSTHNEGESAVAERIIRTLKNKIYKYMTLISKNVYVDKLADIVNKYNIIYYSTIKMMPVDVKSSAYIDFGRKKEKDSKLKVGDQVTISKYRNIFAKGFVPNWSEEAFVIRKVKNTVEWTNIISDLNGEETVLTFYEKNCKRQIKQNLG